MIWGDTTTNILTSSTWTNIYRVLDTTLTNTDRPIMACVATVNTTLPPGTYWLDWQFGGSAWLSGPWAPPVTILGQTTTGNALQYTVPRWAAAVDCVDRRTAGPALHHRRPAGDLRQPGGRALAVGQPDDGDHRSVGHPAGERHLRLHRHRASESTRPPCASSATTRTSRSSRSR